MHAFCTSALHCAVVPCNSIYTVNLNNTMKHIIMLTCTLTSTHTHTRTHAHTHTRMRAHTHTHAHTALLLRVTVSDTHDTCHHDGMQDQCSGVSAVCHLDTRHSTDSTHQRPSRWVCHPEFSQLYVSHKNSDNHIKHF